MARKRCSAGTRWRARRRRSTAGSRLVALAGLQRHPSARTRTTWSLGRYLRQRLRAQPQPAERGTLRRVFRGRRSRVPPPPGAGRRKGCATLRLPWFRPHFPPRSRVNRCSARAGKGGRFHAARTWTWSPAGQLLRGRLRMAEPLLRRGRSAHGLRGLSPCCWPSAYR